MYEVDDKDRVVELTGVPQSDVGAPMPLIIRDEGRAVLAYYSQVPVPHWNGRSVRIVEQDSGQQPVALVRFNGCTAVMSGPPNDEAFSGHPLASRGLKSYGAYRIENSSWIRRLERMNSVHRCHRPERFSSLSHLIFTFHDTTFECVCRDFDVRVVHGNIKSVIPEMVELLRWVDAGS